jgi:hypothetical protein
MTSDIQRMKSFQKMCDLVDETLTTEDQSDANGQATNTPERIVTRSAGARFYCAACGGTYARYPHTRQCKCRVYVSADTLSSGKSATANRGALPSG